MNRFLSQLEEGIIIGDGAMGTMLQAAGLSGGKAPEHWLLEHPEEVLKVHQGYLQAGSRLIETATFGANRIKLEAAGLVENLGEINQLAVKLARQAAGEKIVAGSVGPTGKMMEPYGDLSFIRAREVFQEQIGLLAAAGVDVVCIETMSDLQEMKAAVLPAREAGLPVIAQMTFMENHYTLNGKTPEDTASFLEELGVDIIGANCSLWSQELLPVIRRMASACSRPLSVQPNAGMPVLEGGKTVYKVTPEEFVRPVRDFLSHRVRLLGGCCGTSPDFIRALVREVESGVY